MEVSKGRVVGIRGSVVAGSVWESRMKSDEVRGGIKVFNAEEQNIEENNNNGSSSVKRNPIGGKRKTWKSESSDPIQRVQRNSEEQCKELSISCSSDGGVIKKSPIHSKKIAACADKFERSPIHARKLRSDHTHNKGESSEGQLRKTKSDSIKRNSASGSRTSISIQLRKTKSESDRAPDEAPDGVCEKIEVENGKNDDGGGENCMDFDDVCQVKVISSSCENVDVEHGSTELLDQIGGGDDHSEDVIVDEMDEGDEEKVDEEVEIEMEERIDVKEISIPESKVVKEPENTTKVVVNEQDKKVVVNEPEKKVVVNESEPKKVVVANESEPKKVVVVNESEPKKVVVSEPEPKKILNEPESKRVVSAHTRFHHRNERRPVSVPVAQKQSPPIRRNSTIYQNFSKADSIPKTEEYRSFPQTQQSKLQSLVDLIMWRDVSRSAFLFGFGTFTIVSSSYAKDINLSLISVMSYISLVYLAVIFLYRSLICRGVIEVEYSNYVLGEEDAIWMLKLILPYLNEFLSKLKALFSGDPGTTIKLAVLLFVLARCGNYITIWKMAKFGFFGVFTVPKICSSYSAQLTAYANFWIRRFRDAWDSCTHKKAVALGIFGLVWNLSSVVARIWAVFVLFVAFRYYQQHYMVRDEWGEDDETWQGPVGVGQKQGPASNFVDTNKVKKGF